MLDIKIYTFLTVCETLNYTKASDILHITQPAVSQHIQHLEEEYGTKLFSITGKKISLTDEGEILKKYASAMRNDELRVKELITKKSRTPLNFGVTLTIGEYVIAKPLSRYMKENPDTDIHLEIGDTQSLLTKLKDGRINFAIVEGYFNSSEYDFESYETVPFVAVCSSKHKGLGKIKKLEDLFSENLLLREEGSGTRAVLEKNLAARNFSTDNFNKTIQIGGMHAILELLEDDAGISFLYLPAASKMIEEKRLKIISLSDFKITHDFTCIWNKGSLFSNEYRSICKTFKAMV